MEGKLDPGGRSSASQENHKVRNLNYSLAVVWVGLYAHVLVLDTQTKRPSRRAERRDTPMYADQGWVLRWQISVMSWTPVAHGNVPLFPIWERTKFIPGATIDLDRHKVCGSGRLHYFCLGRRNLFKIGNSATANLLGPLVATVMARLS